MKILIEGSPLLRQRAGYLSNRSGVGNYSYNLLKAAIAQSPNFNWEVIGFRSLKDKMRRAKPGRWMFPKLKHHFVPLMPREIYTRLIRFGLAPRFDIISSQHGNVFLFPNFVRFPVSKNARSAVIVYDLSFIKFPQFASKRLLAYLSKAVPISVAKADKVITISQNSKQEIVEAYQAAPEKIDILYPAVDHKLFKPQQKETIDNIKRKNKIGDSYILFTGTLEPRKNIIGLLNAYAELPRHLQNQYQLVLAGSKGWLGDELEERLHQLKHLPIKLLGYVPDEELPPLYSGASLFVYPSFYEGFGMPPLEAMACGCPVITADNSSLPEVVGRAGLLVKAKDTSAISKAMVKVLSDKKLAGQMSKAGLEQAKKFSWGKSAKQLVQIFNNLAKSKV